MSQMGLPANYRLLRQASTIQERATDRKKGVFVAPFSRTRVWSKKMSDHFFVRTGHRMKEKLPVEHHLKNVLN